MRIEGHKMINGFIAVDPIYIKPAKGSGLIDPATQLEMGSKSMWDEHPFQALVIVAPTFFYNGGYRYESEVKTGDVITLPGHIFTQEMMILDGIDYPVVRYAEIRSFYTPSDEQRKGFKFVREKVKEDAVIPGKN